MTDDRERGETAIVVVPSVPVSLIVEDTYFSLMSSKNTDRKVGEGAISGNQASIPAEVRRAADIEDGDKIRWYWDDGELRVEVVRRRNDSLPEDFDGFEPETESVDHSEVGLETSGEVDAGG